MLYVQKYVDTPILYFVALYRDAESWVASFQLWEICSLQWHFRR